MKLNQKVLAVGCAGVLALAMTGCSKEAVQAETPAQTEAVTEAMAEEATQEMETSEEAAQENAADAEDAMISETITVWGPVVNIEDGSVMIDNQSGISSDGDIILQIAENTRVLDAENGFPVELSEIEEGEMIYANIGPAMTMSLPPQTTAEVIICQVPEDFKVPAYVQVVEMDQGKDESYALTATNGVTYQVAADCQILPFMTRNIVTLQDVEEASTVLVWSDEENNAERLVLFAK